MIINNYCDMLFNLLICWIGWFIELVDLNVDCMLCWMLLWLNVCSFIYFFLPLQTIFLFHYFLYFKLSFHSSNLLFLASIFLLLILQIFFFWLKVFFFNSSTCLIFLIFQHSFFSFSSNLDLHKPLYLLQNFLKKN